MTPFVISDNTKLVVDLKNIFPEIITFNSNFINDHYKWCKIVVNKEQLDFLEILIASHGNLLYATFLSSFSEMIYYFSDTIEKVIVL